MPRTPIQPPSAAPSQRLTLDVADPRHTTPSMLAGHITFCGNCCSCFAEGEPHGSVVQFGTNVPGAGAWCAADSLTA